MDRLLSSLAVIALGIVLLVLVRRGWLAGEVPAGVAYLRPYRPNRDENAVAFHFYVALYFVGGVALIVWGILALFGAVAPIPLRSHP
ncbi:MAG TPA: hypothetical protein VJ891_07020 [Casimicrobiaceae bacterium]|nr:hypothetical protein [Casimicrobiaceae bacterium]